MKTRNLIIILISLCFLRCSKKQPIWCNNDIVGTYSVSTMKYGGLCKTKQNFCFYFYQNNIVVTESCRGHVKGKWYLKDNILYYSFIDSLRIEDTLKYSKMEILRNGNLREKSAKFISTIDPNAVFYKDFIYEKLDDFPPDSFLLSCISVDTSL